VERYFSEASIKTLSEGSRLLGYNAIISQTTGRFITITVRTSNHTNSLCLQLLCFCTLSIVLFLFKTPFCLNLKHDVPETGLSPSWDKNLFSWAHSIELVPISGYLHRTRYSKQTKHSTNHMHDLRQTLMFSMFIWISRPQKWLKRTVLWMNMINLYFNSYTHC
jgi:hypothetical protein